MDLAVCWGGLDSQSMGVGHHIPENPTMTKRGYNTKEAMAYLGVQRRFFERHMAQLLDGKGVRAGTSIIFEKQDLDDAWERYKLSHGSERVQPDGNMKWRQIGRTARRERMCQ